MARILGFSVENYRTLKAITLGQAWNLPGISPLTPLTPMTAVIGKNGVGKSTLFDAFGFLADCLKFGVEEACDSHGRGGFARLRSHGTNKPIMFLISYQENDNQIPVNYYLAIDIDETECPYVAKEALWQHILKPTDNHINFFLALEKGNGFAWTGNQNGPPMSLDLPLNFNIADDPAAEKIAMTDPRKLGIATLGALKQHPRIAAFRQFMEGWYLSYFTPDAARGFPLAGPQRHLNHHGDNLGNVVQFMEREHKERFQGILNRIAQRIPGIQQIDTEKTPDGRLLLRFTDKGFKKPFYAQQVSDGTLKLFAYLLLLEDPTPPPFICIEEPENGLYHKLLAVLVQEFREHARSGQGGSQIFITTHQPYLVDALDPEEVWIMDRGADGFATIQRASDDPLVCNLVAEGLPLGGLWYSDYLDAR